MNNNYNIKINNEIITFKKLNNILYSSIYHLYYNEINRLIDYERLLFTKKSLTNPKYLFVSLYSNSKYKVNFGIFTDNNTKFQWSIINNYIYNLEYKLYLTIYKNKLILSKYKYKWCLENNIIKHSKTGLYISCDFEYNIIVTLDKTKAIQIYIEDGTIHFLKSNIRVQFEIKNIKNNVKINKFMLNIDNKIPNKIPNKLYNCNLNTICILLSAGTSSRFNNINSNTQPNTNYSKQLYLIDNKPLILYSIETIIDVVDKLIIITNIECYDKIKNIINEKYNYQNDKKKKIILLINNINCRLESINTGLQYINKNYKNNNLNNLNNIIIHDVARPYITIDYIKTLTSSNNTTHFYSQYYLKLTNGLMHIDNEVVDRDKYIELCAPLCINYKLFNFIFTNYIQKENMITYEFIPILKILNIKCNFIEGHYKYLKKITTRDDI